MATGTTTEIPTGESALRGADWVHLLERAGARKAATVIGAALLGLGEKRDPLSARLAFGRLNLELGPVPLAGSAAVAWAAGIAVPEYLLEDIVGRVAFLVGLEERFGQSEFPDVLTTLYRTGSDREQIAVLRALPFLPARKRFIPLAREASRTNDRAVFAALACHSAFPAQCLPDAAFEQLILKALFIGVPLADVLDLGSRITPELERMVADYAAERRAAGRPVPSDVDRLLDLDSLPT